MGSYTITVTVYTSTTVVPAASTEVISHNTTTTSISTTMITSTATSYSPDGDAACGRPTETAKKARRQVQQPRRSSCGITVGANPTQVSAACNCYLACTTIAKLVSTSTSGIFTSTEYTLKTSPSTSTATAPTVTVCRSPEFSIQISNRNLYLYYDSNRPKGIGFSDNLAASFYIIDGILADLSSKLAYRFYSGTPDYTGYFLRGGGPSGLTAGAYISTNNDLIFDDTPTGNTAWNCGDYLIIGTSTSPGSDCTILNLNYAPY